MDRGNVQSFSVYLNVEEIEEFKELRERLNRKSLNELTQAECIRYALHSTLKQIISADSLTVENEKLKIENQQLKHLLLDNLSFLLREYDGNGLNFK